jgi:hypothetical protein
VEVAPTQQFTKKWSISRLFFVSVGRLMQRVNKQSLPLPTLEEAAVLREYACQECGIGVNAIQ